MPDTAVLDAPAPEKPKDRLIRDLSGTTLKEFAQEVEDTSVPRYLSTAEVSFNIESSEGDATVRLGKDEVPLDPTATEAILQFLQIPKPFWKRLEPDERQFIAHSRMQHEIGASFMVKRIDKEKHLVGVYEGGRPPINPTRLVEAAIAAVGEQALVYDYRSSVEDFSFDCYVPPDSRKGIGGDKAVGDISYGGLTIGQDRKRNLSPYVQPWFMRLLCTNGMEMQSKSSEDRVDGRRCETVEDVLSELEVLSVAAFTRVEGHIEHFYDMRTKKVKAIERTLRAMGKERGLSARTINALEDLVPSTLDDDNTTEFDLVNLITSQANDPALENRYEVRRAFQVAGGNIVIDHAARCTRCHQRVGN